MDSVRESLIYIVYKKILCNLLCIVDLAAGSAGCEKIPIGEVGFLAENGELAGWCSQIYSQGACRPRPGQDGPRADVTASTP